MRRFALTGGIASGKSTVAALLRNHGIPLASADDLAREVVAAGTPALAAIVQRWGAGMVNEEGTLNRAALAQLVFAEPEERSALEAITHPAIRARAEELFRGWEAAGMELAGYEIPLLFEIGADRDYDRVVVVAISVELQLRRLMEREGCSEAAARSRLAAQLPLEVKLRGATDVIWNEGNLEALEERVSALVTALRDPSWKRSEPPRSAP